jgi:hypothetical protein
MAPSLSGEQVSAAIALAAAFPDPLPHPQRAGESFPKPFLGLECSVLPFCGVACAGSIQPIQISAACCPAKYW